MGLQVDTTGMYSWSPLLVAVIKIFPVVTTGIKPSSNIGSALVSAMYDRSSELGLYQTYTSAHPFDTLVIGLPPTPQNGPRLWK